MSNPNEPTRLPAQEHQPVTEPAESAPADTDALSAATGDTAAPQGTKRRGRGGRRQHREGTGGASNATQTVQEARGKRRQRGAREGVLVEQAPQDPVTERARLVYKETAAVMYDVLYNPATERASDNGESLEEIPEEEWSYKAKRIGYAKSKLDFNYDAKPPEDDQKKSKKRTRGKKRHERPYKEIKADQTADDHEIARDNIVYLIKDCFEADMARVDAAIAEARAKADAEGKGDDVLKVVGDSKQSLEAWLMSRKVELEWGRVEVIRDAADWFDVRVDQVERMMHQITKRTIEQASVEKRLELLDTDEEFLAQEENLSEDIKMFASFLELPLTPGAEATRGVVKRLVDDAKRKVEKLAIQKKQLQDLAIPTKYDEGAKKFVEDRENGMTQIERAKKSIDFLLLGSPVAEKFILEAEKRLVGLSPEEELNFWKGIKDLFEYVSDEIPRELKGRDFQNARVQREAQINRALNLYVRDAGIERFVKMDDQTNPKEGIPQGFGQIVERCRSEAKLIGELKDELFFLMAKMGYETRKATQTALRGSSNSKKIEAVKRLNERVDKARSEAAKLLQEVKPETADMDDATKAALVSANAAATKFKTELAGRNVKDLRWNRKEEGKKEADRPLLLQLRGKMAEVMGLGTLDDLDVDQLREILFPSVAEKAAEGKPEKGETVNAPLIDRIITGDLPEELFADSDTTPDMFKAMASDLVQRLGKALQSGVVSEAVTKQLTILQPKELRLETVQQFMDQLEQLVQACESYKQIFGPDWALKFQLRLKDTKGNNKRGLANVDQVTRMLEFVGAGGDAVRSVMYAGSHHDTLKVALERLKINMNDIALEPGDETELGIKICEQISAGKFAEITLDTLKAWLAEEGVTEEQIELVPSTLRSLLDGQVDATLIAEAYPADADHSAMTPAELAPALAELVGRLQTAGSNSNLTEFIVANFDHTVDPAVSPAEQILRTITELRAITTMFEHMQKYFGPDWAKAAGLLVPETEGSDKLVVDEKTVLDSLEYCATTDALNAFAFDQNPVAEEQLYERLDSGVRERLSKLEINKADQLFFALQCVPITKESDLPEPRVGLQRIANCLEMAARSKKRGDALLAHMRLKEGGEYNVTEVLEVIKNDSWD